MPQTNNPRRSWPGGLLHYFRSFRCAMFLLVPGCFVGSTLVAPLRGFPCQGDTECNLYAKFVQVDTPQLTRRAIHREEPDSKLLNQAGVHATITVRVFVNERGRVVCDMIVGNTNPFLGKLAIEAAKAWTFEPFVKGKRPMGMQGNLVFRIDR